jgi:hypothetical protein
MALRPPIDHAGRLARLDDRVRRLEAHVKGHTETKTFLVPGAITAGLYVPPFWVGVDTDGSIPEYKTIWAFRGILRVGGCSVQWLVNGVQVGTNHDVTTVANEFEVSIDPATWPAAILNDGDIIQPAFFEASLDAADFSGAVYMLTVAA